MLQLFVPLARQALKEPREAASTLLSMGVPREAYWPAFFALVALSVLLTETLNMLSPAPEMFHAPGPLVMAGLTAVISAVSVWAIWKVGRAAGGTAWTASCMTPTAGRRWRFGCARRRRAGGPTMRSRRFWPDRCGFPNRRWAWSGGRRPA